MTTEQLKKYFERKGFNVNVIELEDHVDAEIDTFTEGGVNVTIHLSPFNEADFFSYVDDFDVDYFIDYPNDEHDKKDVEKFHKRLKDIKVDLEYILDYEID